MGLLCDRLCELYLFRNLLLENDLDDSYLPYDYRITGLNSIEI